MKRSASEYSSTGTLLLISVALAMAIVAAVFTGDNSGLARASFAVCYYDINFADFPRLNSELNTTAGTTFPTAPIPVQIESMKVTGPSDLAGSVAIPQPGSSVQFASFADILTELSFGPGSPPQAVESFFDITYRIGGGGGGGGGGGSIDGSWPIEILSLHATGQIVGPGGLIPVEIRESPALASVGMHTITTMPDDMFEIDSFFDVFTELSVNGGPFEPAASSMRLDLTHALPEPSSIVLAIAAAAGGGVIARRFQRG